MRLLERATRLNETSIRAHGGGLAQGRHLARPEQNLCKRGDRSRRVRARSRRHGLGSSPRRGSGAQAGDRPRGRRGRAGHARDVRLPRHVDLYCGTAARPGWSRASPRAAPNSSPTPRRGWRRSCSTPCGRARRISELQAPARDIYRREGVPDPASAVIFFHGLGLSHMDIERTRADGSPNGDWVLEEGMVAPVHLLYPGGEHERVSGWRRWCAITRRRSTAVLLGFPAAHRRLTRARRNMPARAERWAA